MMTFVIYDNLEKKSSQGLNFLYGQLFDLQSPFFSGHTRE